MFVGYSLTCVVVVVRWCIADSIYIRSGFVHHNILKLKKINNSFWLVIMIKTVELQFLFEAPANQHSLWGLFFVFVSAHKL